MKLSKGFTLAEVLITLGIIGVVAAISLPTLQTNVQKQKVGPSLRKFMNTMENANLRLLEDADADIMSDVTTTPATYANLLTKYISGTYSNSGSSINKYDGSSGSYETKAVITMTSGESVAVSPISSGSSSAVIATLYYDLNGATTAPNRLGKDIFAFRLTNKGVVVPVGGKQEFALTGLAYNNLANRWTTKEELMAEITDLAQKKQADLSGIQTEKATSTHFSDAGIAGNAANAETLSKSGVSKDALLDAKAFADLSLDAIKAVDLSQLQYASKSDMIEVDTLLASLSDKDSNYKKTFQPIESLEDAKFTLLGVDNVCNSTTVTTGFGCAGSIADNNWKVVYKY